MTAFNVVRFRVKPGYEEKFVDAHRRLRPAFKGFLGGHLVKTGVETFCFIGQWRTFRSIESARPQMTALLDEFRDMLEDMGGGLGVTDPVSGEAVAKMAAAKVTKKKAAKKIATKKKDAKKAVRVRALDHQAPPKTARKKTAKKAVRVRAGYQAPKKTARGR